MRYYEATARIAASPEAVWAVLSDGARWAAWARPSTSSPRGSSCGSSRAVEHSRPQRVTSMTVPAGATGGVEGVSCRSSGRGQFQGMDDYASGGRPVLAASGAHEIAAIL